MRCSLLVLFFITVSLHCSHVLSAQVKSGHQKALSQASRELESSGLSDESKYLFELGKNRALFNDGQKELVKIMQVPSQRARLLSLTRLYSTQWCSQREKAYCQLAITTLALKEMESLAK